MSYAIVHKQRVILGPVAWAQKYFTDVLKIRHRITANIPGQAPEQFPYVIDENTSIYEVVEDRPEFNAMTEYHYGPQWDISANPIVASYTVEQQTVESARENFKILAAHERYKKEVSGTKVTINGTEIAISTHRGDRDVYVQKYLSLNDEGTINFKFGQQWVNLSKQDLNNIITAINTKVQSAFDWEANIHTQINDAETTEQLMAIEIEPSSAV